MSPPRLRPLGLTPLLLLSALPLLPLMGQTQKSSDDTYADFSKGTARGVTLTDEGFVLLAPNVKKISSLPPANLWSTVQAADGTLYVGTGDEGQVWRVQDSKAELWMDFEEPHVHALAFNSRGELFAATSPNGKIYKITQRNKAEPFFELKEKNIWALLFDATDDLYVGTGDRGQIYKVSPGGKGSVFYDSDEPNIVSLAWDKSGNLLAGSQGTGLLYRINPKNSEAHVLLSSGQKEIKKIALTSDDSLYAVAIGTPRPSPGGGKWPKAQEKSPAKESPPQNAAENQMAAVMEALVSGAENIPQTGPGKGGETDLYYIRPDGYAEKIWSTKSTTHSLTVTGQNALLGTGDEGYLFEVSPQGKAKTVLKLDSAQITGLFANSAKSSLTAVGSNLGALWQIGPGWADEGVFESEVLNSKTFSTWGRISARATTPGGSSLSFETRSGNTPKADKTWSAWAPVKEGRIQSPPAQYCQYRMTLKGKDSPKVDEVSLYWLPRNLPPRIQNIQVLNTSALPLPSGPGGANPAQMAAQIGQMEMARNNTAAAPQNAPRPTNPLDVFGGSFSSRVSSTRNGPNHTHLAYWKASDPNQDPLVYSVYYRIDGDNQWTLLEEKLETPYLIWDTSGWPDGHYQLRVVATDAPSHAPGKALTTEAESLLFGIDSTPPRLEEVAVTPPEATFSVRDAVSNIKSVTVSPDGRDYNVLMPENELFDSQTENFRYKIGKDQQRLFIRMEDEKGNVSADKIDFQK